MEKAAIINGRKVEFSPGQTILEVGKENSIDIPSLCHLPGGKSLGSCGVCVVENVANGELVHACKTPIEEGMNIKTESPAAVSARRESVARLFNSGEHNCLALNLPAFAWASFQEEVMQKPWHGSICPAWGQCELQDLAIKYGVETQVEMYGESGFGRKKPVDDSHPMFVRDYNRCILCGRCIQACNEIQVNLAIPTPEGWTGESPPPEDAFPMVDYDKCVHCGECVQACPVGALFEKKAFGLSVGNETEPVRTTCPYCGVGCQLWLHVKDGKIVKVTGVEGAEPNQGRLCVKGRFGYDFIYSNERLTKPLIRENGRLREASWDEALDLTAGKLKEVIDRYGPDATAGVSCARSINEDSYQMQKLFRAVIKTNNIDHCART